MEDPVFLLARRAAIFALGLFRATNEPSQSLQALSSHLSLEFNSSLALSDGFRSPQTTFPKSIKAYSVLRNHHVSST